jgi:hypothetical protein
MIGRTDDVISLAELKVVGNPKADSATVSITTNKTLIANK